MTHSDTYTCPNCGRGGLSKMEVYYDALVSSLVDYIRYRCERCRFEFMVKEN